MRNFFDDLNVANTILAKENIEYRLTFDSNTNITEWITFADELKFLMKVILKYPISLKTLGNKIKDHQDSFANFLIKPIPMEIRFLITFIINSSLLREINNSIINLTNNEIQNALVNQLLYVNMYKNDQRILNFCSSKYHSCIRSLSFRFIKTFASNDIKEYFYSNNTLLNCSLIYENEIDVFVKCFNTASGIEIAAATTDINAIKKIKTTVFEYSECIHKLLNKIDKMDKDDELHFWMNILKASEKIAYLLSKLVLKNKYGIVRFTTDVIAIINVHVAFVNRLSFKKDIFERNKDYYHVVKYCLQITVLFEIVANYIKVNSTRDFKKFVPVFRYYEKHLHEVFVSLETLVTENYI
uniref:Uncharacterized protein n=1 Tax=Parastrongyloides trichosuri TaxID=131310 RepID=A0A0N5A397_PARTI